MKALNGLILAGGASSRMGSTKALLPYQGQLQMHRAALLLTPFCEEVFLSCQTNQVAQFQQAGWKKGIIQDQQRWGAIGPMNGLLSAFDTAPGPWLLLGCDYPLLTTDDIGLLISSRAEESLAVAFEASAGPEPLIALYEAPAKELLQAFWEKGQESLRRFLSSHPIQRVPPPQPERLRSFDTPEHYHSVYLT